MKLDVAAARQHLTWLGSFDHGSVQLDLSKGNATHVSYHASAETLIAEVELEPHTGWKAQVGVNARPAAWAGAAFRSCPDEKIEHVTNVRLDLDPIRPLSASTPESTQAEYEALRRRAEEKGRPLPALSPLMFTLPAGLLSMTATGEREDVVALIEAYARRARSECNRELEPRALEALAAAAFKGARGQAASPAELALATDAASDVREVLEDLVAPAGLAICSGSGVHMYVAIAPIDVTDPKLREVVKAGLRELERRVREFVEGKHPRIRVDPYGGLAVRTRLAGTTNLKGDDSAERPRRSVEVLFIEERGDGVSARDWVLTEGRRAIGEQAAALAARKAEAAERLRTHPELAGEPRGFERRVQGAIESQLQIKPIADVGHNDALGAMLALAGLLVRIGCDDYCERFAALVYHSDPPHWSRGGLEAEIGKALVKAEATHEFGAFKREMLEDDARKDAAKRGTRGRNVGRAAQTPAAANGATSNGHLAHAYDDDSGPIDYGREGMDDVQEAGSNVRRGPWQGSNGSASAAAPRFGFPDAEPERPLWTPRVFVPKPELWSTPTEKTRTPPAFEWLDTSNLDDISSQGVAERIRLQAQGKFGGFTYTAGAFYLFDGQVWRELPKYWTEAAAAEFHHKCTRKTDAKCERDGRGPKPSELFEANPRSIAAVQARLRSLLEAEQCVPAGTSYFDGSQSLAAFRNATLVFDHGTRTIETPHNAHELRALHGYPFDYEPNLEPHWLLRVMREDWFGGLPAEEVEKRVTVLRQFAGHCMLGSQIHTSQHRALMLLGRGGDGKSTWMDIVRACMPPGSHCAVQPADMSSGAGGGELARAALFGKWANLVEDVSSGAIANTSALKTLIGFGEVSARRIGVDNFTFRSRATQIFAANELPAVTDRTRGFLRRWVLVEFPNAIDAKSFDGTLKLKLLAHEQREIVSWCIDAAIEMLLTGRSFEEPACHPTLLANWAVGEDAVASFIAGATEPAGDDLSGWTGVADLFGEYEQWVAFIYGAYQAARHTASKDRFAKRVATLPGCKSAKRGRNERVVNRRMVTHA